MLESLVRQLDLEQLEVNLFRGQSTDLGNGRVFGGQVIGQALAAAIRTIEGRVPHSLHAYFLLPGDVKAPIVYQVERLRDGRSFSARRVQALQHGRPIYASIASFQIEEPGPEHHEPMPEVPPPERLENWDQLAARWAPPEMAQFWKWDAIEFRPVRPWNPFQPVPAEPRQAIWFRTAGKLPDDRMLHRCMLAYASDHNLVPTALRPHGKSWFEPDVIVASIDHAMWFHRDARADDWLLYVMDSPSAQGARGLARGLIYDREGSLVASVAQEGLMRVVAPKE